MCNKNDNQQHQNNILINEELSKHSWRTIRKFEELFPCLNPLHIIEVQNKEYLDEQKIISLKMKLAKNQGTEYKKIPETFTTEHIRYESVEEFWQRWNRFKKVKSFI